MTPFISIVMPVYNVENYIEKSIQSVLAQTFTDFELLLVDDCSPDKSGKICDAFAKMDKRIKVVHLPKNGGVANARNTVMIPACGEYLCFLDSDDHFDSDMLQVLADSVKKNPAQAVVFGLVEEYYNDNGILKSTKTVTCDEKIIRNKQELREEILKLEAKDLYGYPCNKMYNVAYLKETKAVFPRMRFNEDIIFNIDFFMNAESCNLLSFAPYHYVKHTGSTTGNFIPTYYQDIMVKIDRLYSQLEYWGMHSEKNLEFLALRYTRYLFSALERNCDRRSKMSHKERKQFFKEVLKTERYKKLSMHLNGDGYIGLLARILRTKNSFLCLSVARIIYIVKRFLPKLFTKLS
jgi:glycosyltransferase involved in cell wall biosynthesis